MQKAYLSDSDFTIDLEILNHYGSKTEIMPYKSGPKNDPNFCSHCIKNCIQTESLPNNSRALDIGCSVGGFSFELSKYCKEVVGLELSSKALEIAKTIQDKSFIDYRIPEEGYLSSKGIASLPENASPKKVTFISKAEDISGNFNIVLFANSLCNFEKPKDILKTAINHVAKNGQLIIVSTYQWDKLKTKESDWIGGRKEVGKSFHNLATSLKESFDLIEAKDLYLIKRLSARNFLWEVAQASIWKKF